MAKIYRRAGGRPVTEIIARHKDVQDELDRRAFEIGVRAETFLLEHRLEGDAEIEIAEGDIDRYVVLSDERGQKAALSIEFGRSAYTVTRRDEDGNEFTYEVGEMEGLFILHRASNLPIRRGRQIRGGN
jgi:hypothetical protein